MSTSTRTFDQQYATAAMAISKLIAHAQNQNQIRDVTKLLEINQNKAENKGVTHEQ